MASLLECRHLMDEALLDAELMDKRLLRELIRRRFDDDSDEPNPRNVAAVDTHLEDVWDFLEDIRSTSEAKTGNLRLSRSDSFGESTGGHDREWKLKDDTGLYRVMYRKGPEGTPLHALALEGVIEGPAAMALAIAWEAPKFKEWWPQFSVPPFKIVDSKWVKRIRPGQDVGYIRFKVPWPFATREVAIAAFEMEYVNRGLVIAVMKSVPENPADINEAETGYGPNDVPPPGSNVRMGVTGGYLLQQISPTQCFFRTISNIDMKLDMVPSWVINFLSRQLAGNGFNLLQEAVTEAVENKKGHGTVFQTLVKTEPMYLRVQAMLDRSAQEGGPRIMSKRTTTEMNGTKEAEANGHAPPIPEIVGADDDEGRDEYAGLEERDPEIYRAVLAVDRAIQVLRTRSGSSRNFLTGSQSRSRAIATPSSSMGRVSEEVSRAQKSTVRGVQIYPSSSKEAERISTSSPPNNGEASTSILTTSVSNSSTANATGPHRTQSSTDEHPRDVAIRLLSGREHSEGSTATVGRLSRRSSTGSSLPISSHPSPLTLPTDLPPYPPSHTIPKVDAHPRSPFRPPRVGRLATGDWRSPGRKSSDKMTNGEDTRGMGMNGDDGRQSEGSSTPSMTPRTRRTLGSLKGALKKKLSHGKPPQIEASS
eukprot:TRINITY_DN38711_c0_g1_i1.p1 TRINITY_DN38711_c0_g1~~TRINITY_DN38711_c0_g1_i1.p1  ORF type:complete len:649 (+),score=95.95 TRINITY_DN38711_c0_g1_i1:1030-2976(+)